MRVRVVRNENNPIFFEDVYNAEIRQDAPSGTSVVTVQARDDDTAVSHMITSQPPLSIVKGRLLVINLCYSI